MKRIVNLLLISLLAIAPCASAANDYDMLRTRAERNFSWKEWPVASTLYTLMTNERPAVGDNYARAIVCNALSGDTAPNMQLFSRVMHHGVALDSLFDGVRRACFEARRANVYPEFLKSVRRDAPWAGRAVDARLLDWYLFRQDGPEIVRYASMMLSGLPNDAGFLSALAQGYILQGDTEGALRAWTSILATQPDNYDALLSAGNLAADLGRNDEALSWLERAQQLRPSPYLTDRINRLVILKCEDAGLSGGDKL